MLHCKLLSPFLAPTELSERKMDSHMAPIVVYISILSENRNPHQFYKVQESSRKIHFVFILIALDPLLLRHIYLAFS